MFQSELTALFADIIWSIAFFFINGDFLAAVIGPNSLLTLLLPITVNTTPIANCPGCLKVV